MKYLRLKTTSRNFRKQFRMHGKCRRVYRKSRENGNGQKEIHRNDMLNKWSIKASIDGLAQIQRLGIQFKLFNLGFYEYIINKIEMWNSLRIPQKKVKIRTFMSWGDSLDWWSTWQYWRIPWAYWSTTLAKSGNEIFICLKNEKLRAIEKDIQQRLLTFTSMHADGYAYLHPCMHMVCTLAHVFTLPHKLSLHMFQTYTPLYIPQWIIDSFR